MKRRDLTKVAGLAAVVPQAWAQDKFPSKPISFICPYAAGGGSDQRARQIARFISTALGTSVLVENKPGAGGNIGTDHIAKAKPDGHVIGMGNFAPLAVQGNEIVGGTPAQFARYVASEASKWGKIVKAAGIKPE